MRKPSGFAGAGAFFRGFAAARAFAGVFDAAAVSGFFRGFRGFAGGFTAGTSGDGRVFFFGDIYRVGQQRTPNI
jgi:hypothetical protein